MGTEYQRRQDAKELKTWLYCQQLSEDELYPLLENKDHSLRYAASRRLQLMGSDPILAQAKQRCHDKNYRTREVACFILGQIKTAKSNVPDIMAFLDSCAVNDITAIVRASAIIAMGQLFSNHSADKALWATLKHRCTQAIDSPFVTVRHAIACALIYHADDSIIPLLIRLLRDNHGEVRSWAGCAINGNGYDLPELHEIFREMLTDEHGGARYEAEMWFEEHNK